jgi:flagellar biosynthesis/type III secretory pathway chaperone
VVEKLKNLALILSRMNVLYQRVFNVLERERQLLIKMDFDELFIVLREKDEILSAIRHLDKDRLRIQDQFAIAFDRPVADVTLKTIAEEIISQGPPGDELGQRLLALRDELGKTVAALKEKLELNRNFFERSVENLRGIAEHLSAALTGRQQPGKGTTTYTGKAKFQDTKSPTGSLVEKRF